MGSTFTAATMTEFSQLKTAPLTTCTSTYAEALYASLFNKVVLSFTDKEADNNTSTMASYTAAASSFKGKLLIINVPASESKILDYFGITAAQLPTTVLVDFGNESGIKKFPFAGPHNSATITTFAQSFLNGELIALSEV